VTLSDTEPATQNVTFIVDCGANAGYSSAYFLSRFPSCTLLAIEPDQDTFALLKRNLAPYGGRARTMQAGVWSHSGALLMVDTPYRDGEAWARQVRAAKPGESGDIRAIDIGTILDTSGFPRINILKIDIEGAECEVFAHGYDVWLDRVDTILIELHDDSHFGRGSDAFFAAIAGQGFRVRPVGDITICTRDALPT